MSTKTLNLMQELVAEIYLELAPNEFEQFIQQIQEKYLGSKIIENSHENPQSFLETIEEIRQYMPVGEITQEDIDANCY